MLAALLSSFDKADDARRERLMLADHVRAAMARWPDRAQAIRYDRELQVFVDRVEARYAAWYEMFHRSQGKVPGKGATFADCEERLPEIKAMGFDVIYFVPIHPIGRVHRKGPNNSLTAGPSDPGSPYAIGSAEGGHKAINPELGTLADFRRFVRACHAQGMEVALDFAIQCAPDHPWIREHPDWFVFRPDGTIRYAENPPKKYQDIVNVNFYGGHQQELWNELLSVFLFWIEQGVKIFRVDNPHTKPVPFWEWVIREVRARDTEVIFLSEAFTRPPVMQMLAKVGFSQSYTYFTWRNFKGELIDYLTELTQTPVKEYLRPNFFPVDSRHQPAVPADRRPAGAHDPLRAGLDALLGVRHLQRLRAVRGDADPGQGGVPELREVRLQGLGLGSARQHQGLHHEGQPHPPGQPGAARARQPAVLSGRRRQHPVLRQDDARPRRTWSSSSSTSIRSIRTSPSSSFRSTRWGCGRATPSRWRSC